jgi:hypothetical protein
MDGSQKPGLQSKKSDVNPVLVILLVTSQSKVKSSALLYRQVFVSILFCTESTKILAFIKVELILQPNSRDDEFGWGIPGERWMSCVGGINKPLRSQK